MKDINGKEIYEADIILFETRNLEKVFFDDSGKDYLEEKWEIFYSGQSFNVPQRFIKNLRVIGNIFEKIKETQE
ncbi:YopX family protein [Cytobacillus sp. Hm23]